MHISKLSLRNYRNFKNQSLRFIKGINTIIGENGSGKTNVMNAMRILLDDSLPRSIRFSESDFNRGLSSWKGHWIIIQIFFDELDHGDECQAISIHLMGSADKFDELKGSCCVIYRPKFIIRNQLYEYSQEHDKNIEGLRSILDPITIDDYEILFKSRGHTDFSEDIKYNKYIGNFEDILFPNPMNESSDIFGSKLNIGAFTKEVSCTFVKALRDVESDLRSYRDNPLINLLRGKEKKIAVAKKNDITGKIKLLNEDISSLDEVREVATGIGNNIKTSVGETYAPNLSIRSELPEEMEKLMMSLRLWVGDNADDPYLGRIWELSLGGANLVYLSTKLLEYEKVKSLDKVANFLLIEEPEAHIHTHIQKTLYQKIPEGRTQVIISTHSTHISSVSKIRSVNILSKASNYVEVYEPSNGLDAKQIMKVERYLDAVRTSLLFAKGVILVEGDAEQILIPELFKSCFGVSLDEIGVSLINIGSTGFKNVANLFSEERIKKYCAILTDLDTSIAKLPKDSKEDDLYLKGCRNSELKGIERKNDLDVFEKDNNYIDIFYAKYTFEVDFLLDNNFHEIIQLVKSEYSQKAVIDKISENLKNPNVAVSGKQILDLANKYGKGWFSIMVSEYIDHRTTIPIYILKAIKFAAPELSINLLRLMANKRYSALKSNPFDEDKHDYEFILKWLAECETIEDIVSLLEVHAPHDLLTKFIQL